MPPPLNVPWDKIQTAVENGTPLVEVARLFGINVAAVRQRSVRGKWLTPTRQANLLKAATSQQCASVAVNESLSEQIKESKALENLAKTTTRTSDLEELSKEYRVKAAHKLFRLIESTIITPPKNWKDFDIADKMMRRTLGLDDGTAKNNTIVSLQLVNDRLAVSAQNDILEGEFVEDSCRESGRQSKGVGCIPSTTTDDPTFDELLQSGGDDSALPKLDEPALLPQS